MKQTMIAIITSLFISIPILVSANEAVNYFTVGKYELEETEGTVALETDFSRSFILDRNMISKINQNEIFQIDLVYTENKGNKNFDQVGLNKNRVRQLKRLLPNVNKDQPVWNYVEQTNALNPEMAATYFHGFVIHFRPKSIDYSKIKEQFNDFHTQRKTYTINNNEENTLKYPSGSEIHIESNAVCYMDGRIVEGTYDLIYVEFRNQAEIALSGIPMKYHGADGNYQFSSVGMYEIRGRKNGEELKLRKPITVDFNCTQPVDDASFYALDEKTARWSEIRTIQMGNEKSRSKFQAENEETNRNEEIQVISLNTDYESMLSVSTLSVDKKTERTVKGMTFTMKKDNKGIEYLVMNEKAWESYVLLKEDKKMKDLINEEDTEEKKVIVDNEDISAFTSSVIQGEFVDANDDDFFRQQSISYKGRYGANTRAYGLISSQFGVYNCDQTYRLQNRLTIHPRYSDYQTGKRILAPQTAYLIDLDYNSSFIYGVNNITLNRLGKNALLLTTAEGKFYFLSSKEFSQIDLASKTPKFEMRDVTEILKSTTDLKTLLQI